MDPAVRSTAKYGTVEVWEAYASSALTNMRGTAKLQRARYDASITVAAFSGAGRSLAATAFNTANSGVPTVSLAPRTDRALIWAVGHNWSKAAAVVPGGEQTLVHSYVDARVNDTYWVQSATALTKATSTSTMNDAAPSGGRWQLAAVEIPLAGV